MKQIFKYLSFLVALILICICLSKTNKQECISRTDPIETSKALFYSDSLSVEENLPESKESILNSGYVFAIR